MHIEIQVALNFLISFLYNKLPRRRVNNFGEELEAALKQKFEGHWYPEKPFKGSAFRCVKTAPPLDPVFEIAAREAGMDLSDIQENLPHELSIWIDPGEVSYRMSEKGPVKILYSESDRIDGENPEREVTRTFNPEAQSFKPVDVMSTQFAGLSMIPAAPSFGTPAPTGVNGTSFKSSPSPVSAGGFGPKQSVTYTAAAFAQTKFGSTKLKNSTRSKPPQRMSPTEFGNYIKQRALIQQQISQPQSSQSSGASGASFGSPHDSRAISPDHNTLDSLNFLLFQGLSSCPQTPSPPSNNGFGGALLSNHYPNHGGMGYNSGSNGMSSGLFDSGFEDLLDGGKAGHHHSHPHPPHQMRGHQHPSQDQQGISPLSRFASFFEKPSPFGSVSSGSSPASSMSSSSGASSAGHPQSASSSPPASSSSSSGDNTAKQSTFENLNLTGVSYPNQYQHLLLAN